MRTLDFANAFIRSGESDGNVLMWKSEGDHGGFELSLSEDLERVGRLSDEEIEIKSKLRWLCMIGYPPD